jgi:hypothetical protein
MSEQLAWPPTTAELTRFLAGNNFCTIQHQQSEQYPFAQQFHNWPYWPCLGIILSCLAIPYYYPIFHLAAWQIFLKLLTAAALTKLVVVHANFYRCV